MRPLEDEVSSGALSFFAGNIEGHLLNPARRNDFLLVCHRLMEPITGAADVDREMSIVSG